MKTSAIKDFLQYFSDILIPGDESCEYQSDHNAGGVQDQIINIHDSAGKPCRHADNQLQHFDQKRNRRYAQRNMPCPGALPQARPFLPEELRIVGTVTGVTYQESKG